MIERNPVVLRERRLKYPLLAERPYRVFQTGSELELEPSSASTLSKSYLISQEELWNLFVDSLHRVIGFLTILFLWNPDMVESNWIEKHEKEHEIPPSTIPAVHQPVDTPPTVATSSVVQPSPDELLIVVDEWYRNDDEDIREDVELFAQLVRLYTQHGPTESFEEAQYGTVLSREMLTDIDHTNSSNNSSNHKIKQIRNNNDNNSNDDPLNGSLLEIGLFTPHNTLLDDKKFDGGLLDSLDVYNKEVAQFYIPRVPKQKYSLVDSLLSSLRITKLEVDERRQKIKQDREKAVLVIHPLKSDQQLKVDKIWRNLNQQMIVSSAFQIDISVRDMQSLRDGLWLNDNVIDFYLNLVSLQLGIYAWTTHFFLTLELKGYQGVARWAKRRKLKIADQERILTPINIMGTHWALAVIDIKNRAFKYYDSLLSSGNERALLLLQDYMVQEAKKQGDNQDYSKFDIFPLMDTPQQLNGYDCGVFTCMLALFAARNKLLSFSQKDMKILRRRMAYEILSKELLS